MTEGPYTYTITKTVCLGCKYLKSQIRITGKNPIRDYYCTHPKSVEDQQREIRVVGLFDKNNAKRIGNESDTPSWCPYLSDIKK